MLKHHYGITLEQKEAMLASQGGACAICKTKEPGGKYDVWHVDHCHVTDRVRGILCSPCNVMLGCARDNPDILAAAGFYLASQLPLP